MLICYIHLFIVLYNKSCRYGNNKNQIPYLFRKNKRRRIILSNHYARVTRQINTGYKIFPSEWDKHLACIILPDNNDIRRRFLAQLTSQIAEDMHRLKKSFQSLNIRAILLPPEK